MSTATPFGTYKQLPPDHTGKKCPLGLRHADFFKRVFYISWHFVPAFVPSLLGPLIVGNFAKMESAQIRPPCGNWQPHKILVRFETQFPHPRRLIFDGGNFLNNLARNPPFGAMDKTVR